MTRRSGRIRSWNDDRGFGFIASARGNDELFLHISAFADRSRRPTANDAVTYRLGKDPGGRLRAVDVAYVNANVRARTAVDPGPVWRKIGISGTFMAILLLAVASGLLPGELFGLYFLASAIAFVMYWYDKSAARTSRWRTAENTLHSIDLLGGWPGSLVAMEVFRHKSRKASFRTTFWVTVIVNCGFLVWLASPAGASFVKSILEAV